MTMMSGASSIKATRVSSAWLTSVSQGEDIRRINRPGAGAGVEPATPVVAPQTRSHSVKRF